MKLVVLETLFQIEQPLEGIKAVLNKNAFETTK